MIPPIGPGGKPLDLGLHPRYRANKARGCAFLPACALAAIQKIVGFAFTVVYDLHRYHGSEGIEMRAE